GVSCVNVFFDLAPTRPYGTPPARRRHFLSLAREPTPLTTSMSVMTLRPVPRPGVLDIAPYVPGKSKGTGGRRTFNLSSHETPLGPSPKAVAAYRAAGEHLQLYPDGAATGLREAIGRTFGLDPARIVCGAGSDEILNLLAHAYLSPGDEAIHTEHGFLVYPI